VIVILGNEVKEGTLFSSSGRLIVDVPSASSRPRGLPAPPEYETPRYFPALGGPVSAKKAYDMDARKGDDAEYSTRMLARRRARAISPAAVPVKTGLAVPLPVPRSWGASSEETTDTMDWVPEELPETPDGLMSRVAARPTGMGPGGIAVGRVERWNAAKTEAVVWTSGRRMMILRAGVHRGDLINGAQVVVLGEIVDGGQATAGFPMCWEVVVGFDTAILGELAVTAGLRAILEGRVHSRTSRPEIDRLPQDRTPLSSWDGSPSASAVPEAGLVHGRQARGMEGMRCMGPCTKGVLCDQVHYRKEAVPGTYSRICGEMIPISDLNHTAALSASDGAPGVWCEDNLEGRCESGYWCKNFHAKPGVRVPPGPRDTRVVIADGVRYAVSEVAETTGLSKYFDGGAARICSEVQGCRRGSRCLQIHLKGSHPYMPAATVLEPEPAKHAPSATTAPTHLGSWARGVPVSLNRPSESVPEPPASQQSPRVRDGDSQATPTEAATQSCLTLLIEGIPVPRSSLAMTRAVTYLTSNQGRSARWCAYHKLGTCEQGERCSFAHAANGVKTVGARAPRKG
jgi:hypothetical protein